MLDLIDHRGLICGYEMGAAGELKALNWDQMDDALADESGVVWLHFNQADVRSRHWIEACQRIPPSAKAVLLGDDAHMRIETAGAGLAGVSAICITNSPGLPISSMC